MDSLEPIFQGDALFIDYFLENWATFYATWGDTWTGTFKISPSVTAAATYSGALTRTSSPGLFTLQLGYDSASTAPALNWSAVPVESYVLVAQIRNTTVKYQKEFHDRLVIQAQGL